MTHAHRRTRLVGVVIYHVTVFSFARSHFFGQVWLQEWLNYPLSPKRRVLIDYLNLKLMRPRNATGGETSGPPQKCKKYSCSFRKEYNKRFPWATDSKKGPSFAFCMPCGRDISLAQGGTKDLRKHEHEQTTVHTKAHQGTSGIKPLYSYFGPVRNEEVIVAEVKFGYFLGEHHLAFYLLTIAIDCFVLCSLIL